MWARAQSLHHILSSHGDWFRDGTVTHFGLTRVSSRTPELLEKWYFLFAGAPDSEINTKEDRAEIFERARESRLMVQFHALDTSTSKERRNHELPIWVSQCIPPVCLSPLKVGFFHLP